MCLLVQVAANLGGLHHNHRGCMQSSFQNTDLKSQAYERHHLLYNRDMSISIKSTSNECYI